MPEWTREQRMAIDARNHTILVSAAAGSGKTAVLVERIVQLIREGYRLNRMLIVTFTRAAAGEMRQRLGQRLSDEMKREQALFGQALDDLEGTDISTIHAFCQRVIRQEFQSAGIDPMARVCEEQQRQMLFEQAFRAGMNELLDEGGDACFERLTRCFPQQSLLQMTQELYTFLMSMPGPFEWLHDKVEAVGHTPVREHPWYGMLLRGARLEIAGIESCMEAMREMLGDSEAVDAYRELWQSDWQQVSALLNCSASNADGLAQALMNASFARAPVCRKLTDGQKAWKDEYNKVRKEMKDIVEQHAAALNIDEEATAEELAAIRDELRGMETLVKRVHRHFMEGKNRENVVDFSDLEQMTLQILNDLESKRQLEEQYDHIFVDECQDVSAVQDAIIQQIHGEGSCLFMVGDVKQSIYRFRLADPTLFLHRMRTFSDDARADERRIFLQKNFRSRGNVLDATNRVFRDAMRADVTELDYLPEDELICGRGTSDDPVVEIRLAEQPESRAGKASCLESETAVVARRIRELLQTRFYDGKQERNYQYRDMVILLQKMAGVGAKLAELLQSQGIPVYFDGADNYFQLPEIRVMKALLSVIDNPLQDVQLITALKNLPFEMTDGELSEIRCCRMGKNVPFYAAFEACCDGAGNLAEKCAKARAQLREWHFLQENMQLSDFVWRLTNESGLYAACGAYPEGELRQANLRLLRQKAAEYEQNQGGGLSGFLKMIDLQMTLGDSTGAKVLGENENLVRIMTMHKSKGLEFPVVFCMRLTAGMAAPSMSTLRMHSRLGVCLPYVNEEMSIRRGGLGDEAFALQKRLDEMAERCRLLYVAMTRAREVLVLTGCSEKSGKTSWRMPTGSYRVWSATSMMDWVMQTVCSDTEDVPWRVSWEQPEELAAAERADHMEEMREWLGAVLRAGAEKCPWAWLSEPQARSREPLKTSVSSLARKETLNDPMPLWDTDEEAADKRVAEEITAPLRLSEIPARPAFMEERRVTGAERGTLTHKLLALVDLEALRGRTGGALHDAVYKEADRLRARDCLTAAEMNVIDLTDLAAFFESKLGQRLLRSEEAHREWGFNLRVSRETNTLVQGVIDCAFKEDGAWVLVDYKTDRIESEAAFQERHRAQMAWYARALEEITGMKVKEKYLYSLSLGKAFEV